MSDVPKRVFATLPKTTRGKALVLGGDPKNNKNILYTHKNSVIIRNVSNPTEADIYTEHAKEVFCAKYSPSGFYIASGDAAGKVRIWDTTQKEHILKNEYQPLGLEVRDLAWDGESKRIAVCGNGREKFGHAFLVDSGSSVGDLSSIPKAANSISIKSTRPYRIVIGSEDYNAYFYAGPPFKYDHSLSDHTNFVNVVQYSPNGEVFATGSSDKKVLIYDGKSGELNGELGNPAHDGGVYSLSFSPDSKEILTVSGDKTAKIWNLESKELVTTFKVGDTIDDMLLGCLWQAENIIAVALSGFMYYFDRNNPSKPLRIIKGHNFPIEALSLSEDKQTIYTGDSSGRVVIWNAVNGENEIIQSKGSDKIQIMDMLISDGMLVTISINDTIRFTPLNTQTGQVVWGDNVSKIDSQPRGLAVSAGCLVVACIKHIVVYRNGSRAFAQDITYEGRCVEFVPNESIIAVGNDSTNGIHFYKVDSNSLSKVATIDNQACAMDIKFSPNGEYFVTAGADRNVRLFKYSDLKTQMAQLQVSEGKSPVCNIKEVYSYPAHTAKVLCIAWSPDGSKFATAGIDSNIAIWTVEKMNTRKIIRAHALSQITRMTFLDNNTLVSVGRDSNVKQWDV